MGLNASIGLSRSGLVCVGIGFTGIGMYVLFSLAFYDFFTSRVDTQVFWAVEFIATSFRRIREEVVV